MMFHRYQIITILIILTLVETLSEHTGDNPGEGKLVMVTIVTGDQFDAGTEANVKIALIDDAGTRTQDYTVDRNFRDEFKRGDSDVFKLRMPDGIGRIVTIELWRDGTESDEAHRWFVDEIYVKNRKSNEISIFPVFRWIKPDQHYIIEEYDCSLPQSDPNPTQRAAELDYKQDNYVLIQKFSGTPAQVDVVPEDEHFSDEYTRDNNILMAEIASPDVAAYFIPPPLNWPSIDDLKAVYDLIPGFPVPTSAEHWDSDEYFGNQRIASQNHDVIKLCTEIPTKFGVTDGMMGPFLEGLTIQQAIDQKRLFIVDLEILKDLTQHLDRIMCAPIALFFENDAEQLLPVAIQLYQDAASDNPVFLPSDPKNVWSMVKLWYNMADGQHHESITHLALTHLMMESVWVSVNRQISPSHPVFKLLAPHFLFVIAINDLAINGLIAPGGTFDQTTTAGIIGLNEMVGKKIQTWRLHTEGTLPENLRQRGLLDENVLDYFPFRDDALLLYRAIERYVTEYINHYYEDEDTINDDWELQAWWQELVKPKADVGTDGGAGILGVPGNNGFITHDHIIRTLTALIYISSAGHASTNGPQYNEYGFPLSYPGFMRGTPPTDKTNISASAFLTAIPDRFSTFKIMVMVRVLSHMPTQALGDFEVNYIFDPPGVKIVKRFVKDLRRIEKIIRNRNRKRLPYTYLHPDVIPNSIVT